MVNLLEPIYCVRPQANKMCFNWYLRWTQIKHQQTNIYREDYHLILLYNSTVLTSLIILTEDKSRNAQSRNKKNTTLPPQRENYLSACIATLYLLHKWTLNLLFWKFINFCFTFYWGSVSLLWFFSIEQIISQCIVRKMLLQKNSIKQYYKC